MPEDPREARAEDAFDVDALHHWLSARVPGLTGSPEVRQFTGGASNLTYLLRHPERELVLRRPPAGVKAAAAHDLRREHRVQQALTPHYRQVPARVAALRAVDALAALHSVDIEAAGLRDLGRGPGDVARQDLGHVATYRESCCRRVAGLT